MPKSCTKSYISKHAFHHTYQSNWHLCHSKNGYNVANHPKNYTITWTNPAGVVMVINPMTFSIGIGSQKTQVITFTLRATQISSFVSFGNIMFKGNLGHTVCIPISIINKQL